MTFEKSTPNRLIGEKSPYLLQHAHNTVHWWPWCEEAFETARAEDKPVFLSVGYSTCHWCHVMERESFEDTEVAAVLNRDFVSIKVDREERPDIDAVYMNVTQALTGSGGWPMSVFLDGEKRPFYAGTYFPKRNSPYGPSFTTLLNRLSELWKTDRPRLVSVSRDILSALNKPERGKNIDYEDAIQKGYRHLKQSFEPKYGGFGRAPKFPSPHNLMLLLRHFHLYHDPKALEMAEKTLVSMYRGGIRDHVGGGFCRYATDEKWLAPHFEKMLYDNALLAVVYSEAFALTRKLLYKRAAEEIFMYVFRDMTSPEGAFYSAEDADSEGEEGKFYTFTKKEILSLLGDADGQRFCQAYDISEQGNFEGRNIPNLIENGDYESVLQDDFYTNSLHKLFAYREKRTRPLRDDKILASWNGLMIYALAYAGRSFDNSDYIEASKKAADFIIQNMTSSGGRLYTRFRDGEARFSGVAEDYAFVIMGFIELYQASFDVKYLSEAYRLNQILIDDFFEDGALYQTGKNSEDLIARPRELYDGALPSYNSVSISNFAKLSHLCDDPALTEYAEAIIRFFGTAIEQAPSQFGFALCGMMMLGGASRQIVIAGHCDPESIRVIRDTYQPFTTLALANAELAQRFENYDSYGSGAGEPAIYLCEGGHCELPIHSIESGRTQVPPTP